MHWLGTILLVLLREVSVAADPVLNASSGVYRGRTIEYRERTVQQYLGIEYARIVQRFARAQPIRRENDSLINATALGPVCKSSGSVCSNSSCAVQYGIFSFPAPSAEQCLFLNVFLPANTTTDEKKAVLMWIHGGSGQIGSGNVFDGTMLAALGEIIVVTFNFRLNLFGFLSSGDERLEGNVGLYDQSLVLDWISENSEALGADPQRLTIGGHSAGAPHAYYLAISPLSRGRARRLLLQSGCPLNIWSFIRPNQAMERFRTVAEENACVTPRATFEEQLQCLRERDFHLLTEQDHFAYTSANHTNVVLHGEYMRNFHQQVTRDDLDMLIGSTDDEGQRVKREEDLSALSSSRCLRGDRSGADRSTESRRDHFTQRQFHGDRSEVSRSDAAGEELFASASPGLVSLVEYSLNEDEISFSTRYEIHPVDLSCSQRVDCYCSSFYNYSRLISDILFYNDYYRFLQQRSTQSKAKTFLYRYSHWTSHIHPTVCHSYLHRRKVVGHFAELEFTWGVPFVFEKTGNQTPLIQYLTDPSRSSDGYSKDELQFSAEMIEQWTNFVKYGQPNSTRFADRWRSMSNGSLMHLKLNASAIEPFLVPSSVQFWQTSCPADETPPADEVAQLAVLVLFTIGVLVTFFTV